MCQVLSFWCVQHQQVAVCEIYFFCSNSFSLKSPWSLCSFQFRPSLRLTEHNDRCKSHSKTPTAQLGGRSFPSISIHSCQWCHTIPLIYRWQEWYAAKRQRKPARRRLLASKHCCKQCGVPTFKKNGLRKWEEWTRISQALTGWWWPWRPCFIDFAKDLIVTYRIYASLQSYESNKSRDVSSFAGCALMLPSSSSVFAPVFLALCSFMRKTCIRMWERRRETCLSLCCCWVFLPLRELACLHQRTSLYIKCVYVCQRKDHGLFLFITTVCLSELLCVFESLWAFVCF